MLRRKNKKIGRRLRIEKKARRKKSLKRRYPKRRKKELREEKRPSSLQLVRAEENPIIEPRPEHDWEAWQTFNPGIILLEGKVHFLYRAIGQDGISRLGYAASQDGFKIDERLSSPVYEHRLNIKIK